LRPDEWNEKVSSLRKDQGREQNRDSGPVEKVRSSLLKKLFSTILKLTPLQIRNSRSAQTVEFAAVLFVKNGARKNLQFALGVPFLGFFNTPTATYFSRADLW
jgi:hypothetical protein